MKKSYLNACKGGRKGGYSFAKRNGIHERIWNPFKNRPPSIDIKDLLANKGIVSGSSSECIFLRRKEHINRRKVSTKF